MTTSSSLLDQVFQEIMTGMVRTGYAPGYAEVAAELGIAASEALTAFGDIMASGYPGWLDEHDAIATLCPFSNRPNEYRISVDGEQKWFGQ